MAQQAARCCVLIVLFCFSLSNCQPLPKDDAVNIQKDELIEQTISDESGQDDLYSDDDYQTDAVSSAEVTPQSALTSSIQTGRKTVTGSSRPVTLGRHTSPSQLIPVSKQATAVSTKLTEQTIITHPPIRTGKTIETAKLSTALDESNDYDSAEDYSAEIIQPISNDSHQLKNSKEQAERKSHAQTSKISSTSDAKISTKSFSQSRTNSSRETSNVLSATTEESDIDKMNRKTAERGHASIENVTSASVATDKQEALPEAPKTTFSPVMIAQTMTSPISQTTSLPIEVKLTNTVAFQHAQQPSITASPHTSAPTLGQQTHFAHSTANPTFTQTFTQPAAPPLVGFTHWPVSPPVSAFMTQPAFATADSNQATHQEGRVQTPLSNLPQHPVPAHVAFQHSHVASPQQQMATGDGSVTQPVQAHAVAPSSVTGSQPVGTAVGQPIWIRTKNGLSQANLLPVSVLSHFIPTFKSTGVRIVPPTLIKTESS